MIKIIKFESYKESLFPYLYAQQDDVIQQYMVEDEEIIKMKTLTCDDNIVDEVCMMLKKNATCFENYIGNLRRVNQMLLKGITLSEIISILQENKYENIIHEYDERQLVYERVILLKQFNTIKKQLALLDEEFKRRLEDGRK